MVRVLIGAIPEGAERLDTLIRPSARDQSRVGGADRRPRDPQLGARDSIMSGGVGSALKGAEADPASEDKRHRSRASLSGGVAHNMSWTDRPTSARPAGWSSVRDRRS